jgi:hypothetical protein
MTIITLSNKIINFKIAALLFCILSSCGSYQYVGMYDDGIYDSSLDRNNSYTYDSSTDQINNSYYEDYFKGKAIELNQAENLTSTTSEKNDYNSQNSSEESSYAGWGQNVDSNIIINIRTRPSYGMYWGWNNWGWNNWGWNNWGWNNWRWNNWGYPIYGFYDPYFSNSWFVHTGGYSYFGPNRGPSYALINGYRNQSYLNSGYRSASISSRSAMGTVTKFRTSNTRTSARTYKTTQVNNSSNNKGVRTNKNSVQKRDYNRKNNNSSRKIDYNRKSNSQRSNNYSWPSESPNRNSGSMRNSTYSRSNMSKSSGRSSSKSSRSRGGGSSNRRQR